MPIGRLAKFGLLLGLTAVLLASSSHSGESAPTLWNQLADGIDYRRYELPDPNIVHVARMDRFRQDLILDSTIADGTLSHGMETVSGMARRYDRVLNNWGGTWGQRNKVVVAINGSFHNQYTGVPYSGQIQSGWYAKRFDDKGGGSGFVWNLDREAFIGGCIIHRYAENYIRFHRTNGTLWIGDINRERGRHEAIMYTPQFDYFTRTGNGGLEVLIQLTRPAMILESPGSVLGYVTGIRDGPGSTYIPFDHVVLSASGSKADVLRRHVEVGDAVGISMDPAHYLSDCKKPHLRQWSRAYASVSGSFIFLQDRQIDPNTHDRGATLRNPRTAICYNAAYMYFVVVDGRSAESRGMSMKELGLFCRNTLGATSGINQDGGGSSAMWINGEIVNTPSDGRERPVANGMMMVEVLPKEVSTAFTPGDSIVSTSSADIRLGPGSNYQTIHTAEPDIIGRVRRHRNFLDGVLATGSNWWKVDLDGFVGWVDESSIGISDTMESPAVQE